MPSIPAPRNVSAPKPNLQERLADLGLGEAVLDPWLEDLKKCLEKIRETPGQGAGFIEETVRQRCREIQRCILQAALQKQADSVAAKCPKCVDIDLIYRWQQQSRPIRTMCGPVQVTRTGGYCKKCDLYYYPADVSLGLSGESNASPLVQEVSALLVSKMPAQHAEEISLRVCGIQLNHASLARDARRQGDRAIEMLPGLHAQAAQVVKGSLPGEAPSKPFTLVLQIDAWNIRERDFWNQTAAKTGSGEDFSRWHWVYTATCYRLDQRCVQGRPGKPRAVITERSHIATRGGVEAMIRQLHAEAMRRGLPLAERILIIADGAVWIWNAAKDRFHGAVLRLDLFHANAYLWAVAHELHGAGTAAARQWVKPLLRQVREDQTPAVIAELKELLPTLTAAQAKKVNTTVEYYTNNIDRMKYTEADLRREPVGSGTIESTCRQYQCRMKRCGQFWSQLGDEALLTLDSFWRNGYWEKLFPHAQLTSVSRN